METADMQIIKNFEGQQLMKETMVQNISSKSKSEKDHRKNSLDYNSTSQFYWINIFLYSVVVHGKARSNVKLKSLYHFLLMTVRLH